MRIVEVQELKMTIFQTRPPFANTTEVVASEDGSTIAVLDWYLLTFLLETLVFYPLGFGPYS